MSTGGSGSGGTGDAGGSSEEHSLIALSFVMVFVYAGLSVFGGVQFSRLMCCSVKRWRWTDVFPLVQHLIVTALALCQFSLWVYAVVNSERLKVGAVETSKVSGTHEYVGLIIVTGLAYYLKFNAFSLLVYHWVSVYHMALAQNGDATGRRMKQLKWGLVGTNVFILVLICSLYGVSAARFDDERTTDVTRLIGNVAIITVTFVVCVAFAVYGTLIARGLARASVPGVADNRKPARKFFVLTCVFTILWLPQTLFLVAFEITGTDNYSALLTYNAVLASMDALLMLTLLLLFYSAVDSRTSHRHTAATGTSTSNLFPGASAHAHAHTGTAHGGYLPMGSDGSAPYFPSGRIGGGGGGMAGSDELSSKGGPWVRHNQSLSGNNKLPSHASGDSRPGVAGVPRGGAAAGSHLSGGLVGAGTAGAGTMGAANRRGAAYSLASLERERADANAAGAHFGVQTRAPAMSLDDLVTGIGVGTVGAAAGAGGGTRDAAVSVVSVVAGSEMSQPPPPPYPPPPPIAPRGGGAGAAAHQLAAGAAVDHDLAAAAHIDLEATLAAAD